MIIGLEILISFGHARSSPREGGEITGLWVYIYGFQPRRVTAVAHGWPLHREFVEDDTMDDIKTKDLAYYAIGSWCSVSHPGVRTRAFLDHLRHAAAIRLFMNTN